MNRNQKIPDDIIFHKQPTFYFIGVTTAKSSINQVFPLWKKELGKEDVVLEGIDHPIHDDPNAYRRTVEQIKFDPLSLGGLVTTHKMDLYAAAKDIFDYLDPYAQLCAELSSISKSNGMLEGHAKDPFSAGLSLDTIIGKDYFGKTGGKLLIFGAGGSSIATVLHLINEPEKVDRPDHITVVNRSQPRLDHMREMVAELDSDIDIRYVNNNDPEVNDELMVKLPRGSIVINATGMGKDTPGSPITDAGAFPQDGIAWDFNYRGELEFLKQAVRQKKDRGLLVEDGWVYFLHGWTQVVFQVFHIDLTKELFDRLAKAAEIVKS
jgi:shikimate 5-dehydrogenase